MRHARIRKLLQDFAGGELPPAARREAEEHLAGCAACRSEAARLEALLGRARALPHSLEPPRDLWPEIAGRLWDGETAEGAGSSRATAPAAVEAGGFAGRGSVPRTRLGERTLRSARPWLAAAAVVLVALSSATTALLVTRPRAVPPPWRGNGGAAVVPTAVTTEAWPGIEGGYLRAAAELRATLEAARDRLDPETMGAVERNLAIIDGAILEAREALAADPGNSEMAGMLAAMYEKKLDVLRQVSTIRAGT